MLAFRLVTEAGANYTHSSISINNQTNIEVNTSSTLSETFFLEGYFDQSQFLSCHNLFKDDLKRLKVQVEVKDKEVYEKAECTFE